MIGVGVEIPSWSGDNENNPTRNASGVIFNMHYLTDLFWEVIYRVTFDIVIISTLGIITIAD